MKLFDGTTAADAPAGDAAFAPDGSTADGFKDLVGQIGCEVAAPLTAALERVNAFGTTGRIDRAGLRALRDDIECARRLALSAQQISRFAGGRVRQDPQRLSLATALQDALGQRSRETASRGIELRHDLKPADVIVDPSMASALLQSVLSWSFEHARSPIELRVDIKSWPAHARLGCRFANVPPDERAGQGAAGATQLDSVQWQLLRRLAQVMGLVVKREDRHGQTQLTLEFPRTVGESVVSLATLDLDRPGPVAPNSQPMVGRHVLVIASRRETRNMLRDTLRSMGMMVDYVGSVDEARQFCDGGLPHAVIVEAALAGENFRKLRAELARALPSLAFIEIAEQGRELQVSDVGGLRTSLVGRDVLASALPSALMFELSRGS
jgi:uncharacterized protein with HEPN domain